MTETPAILVTTRQGGIAILEINRPASKNSMSNDLLAAMAAELRALRHDDDIRAVIITGAGGTFCAGADITGFDTLRDAALLGAREEFGGTFWSDLATFPKPVIAAIEGLALGGGCELALACDIAIAGESAKFAVPEVKLGVIPGAGGTQRLVGAVGKSKAMAMLLSGDFRTADQACAAGLIAETVPDGEARAHAVALAQRIAKNSPLAVALAKDAALRALETSLSQGLEHEKRNFHIAVRSADCHEGQSAFLAKRAPAFTGK
ncbi:2,3-dehydroadipyl-CoA hydratase [Rhodococcus sp. ACS1]|uniref:enoyl-CoA hydratase/isomerase family protein n=1 Tax=Rhodococcus sp. ACS1 TaxID=2028570 RepID=UPI000BB11A7C|nr:enoyl-CoA hydratase-related protein [Rhodococcus sp. ACS1]PBC47801.1 2,3-dehydroadipyl-CoA hydratase [Rhodococcus sp. ACS1]